MSKLGSAVVLGLATSACTGPQTYAEFATDAPQVRQVLEIRQDAEGFLTRHQGDRVLVEGYFDVTFLYEAFAPDGEVEICSWDRDRYPKYVELELPISGKLFERAVDHWVVVEARVSVPRVLRRGGGDLVVESQPWEQYLVLDDAKLIAIDDERSCSRPAR